MNSTLPEISMAKPIRHWRADLSLAFKPGPSRTVLFSNRHNGPLRVQRPFYPEDNGCCHIYLLHPPGGMVVGDELTITAQLAANSHALITTPSAGRFYRVDGSATEQIQAVQSHVEGGACLEWLPQETILFNDANAHIKTRFELAGDAKLIAWDIVCLGRPAAQEKFEAGHCKQTLEIWRDGRCEFIERNRLSAGDDIQKSVWGFNNAHAFGTMLASVKLTKQQIDALLESLQADVSGFDSNCWGLTQKRDLFIARYLGQDTLACKAGFELLWKNLRPSITQQAAVIPRIWRT